MLVVALSSLVLWLVLSASGVAEAAQIATTFGIVIGLVAGGYLSGRLAPFSPWFHGALSGLAMAAMVLAISRLGGSPAPTLSVLWLAVLAIVLGAAGGLFGGRPRVGEPG